MKIYRGAIFDMDGTLVDTLADLYDSVNEMLAHYNLPLRTLEEVRQFVGNGARKLMIRSLPADCDFVDEALAYYNDCYARNCTNKVKPYAGIMEFLAALEAKKIPLVGNGARKLMIRSLPSDCDFVDDALAYYNDCYARNCTNKVKPYAGIMECLAALAAKKIPLGICTNKQHFAAIEIAEKILAPIKFSYVSGDEPGQPRKPDPTRALEGAKKFSVAPEDIAYFGDTAVDMETAKNAGFLPIGVTWGFRPRSELVNSGAKIIVDHPQEILERINFA